MEALLLVAERREERCTACGTQENFLSTPSADLPDGQISETAVESPLQKYFHSHTPQITSRTSRIPPHHKGRIAIVTDAGCGCGGRGSVLRAMGLQGG
jgi:hypothetical protein